jgi:hypothetical protein
MVSEVKAMDAIVIYATEKMKTMPPEIKTMPVP